MDVRRRNRRGRGSRRRLIAYWRCFRDGSVGGVLGGAALIAFFFVYDLIRLEPFATPVSVSGAVLGGGPLGGGADLSAVVQLGSILRSAVELSVFAVVHLLVFGFLGIGAAVFFRVTDTPPKLLSGALYGLLVCSLVFYVSLGLTSGGLSGAPDWRAVAAGNLLAGAVIAGFLRRKDESRLVGDLKLTRSRLYGGDELV